MTQYTPYFFDGRLHFPKETLDALIYAGLPVDVARTVRHGVSLGDAATLYSLRTSAQTYINRHPASDPISCVLASADVRFMMSDHSAGV